MSSSAISRRWSQANMEVAGWLQLRCVRRGRQAGSGGGNELSVQEMDIYRYKTANVIVMVLSENQNTSKLSIFLCIAEQFLPSLITLLDNLPRVTVMSILNATLAHFVYTHTRSLHHRCFSLRLHLVCTYFIY